MFKLLYILFVIKLYGRINIYKAFLVTTKPFFSSCMKGWKRLSDKIKNILLINKFKAIILKFTEVFAIHDTDGIKLQSCVRLKKISSQL